MPIGGPAVGIAVGSKPVASCHVVEAALGLQEIEHEAICVLASPLALPSRALLAVTE